MSENLIISKSTDKNERYAVLIPQIEALISSENDLIANMANTAAALKEGMGYFWVGFYRVKQGGLVLGPFQGPVACTRIKNGEGVCGTSWSEKRTVIVKDVDQFPGHISCNAKSKSEIVIPGYQDQDVIFVLDIDSDKPADFDEIDKQYLEYLVKILEKNSILN